MIRDLELDLATVLDADTGLTLTAGTNLFAGALPTSAPDQVVCVRATTGEHSAVIGEYETGAKHSYTRLVQVLVRGTRREYASTLALATSVWEALHHPTQSSFFLIRPLGAGPEYTGPDDNFRHQFSFQVECGYSAETP